MILPSRALALKGNPPAGWVPLGIKGAGWI